MKKYKTMGIVALVIIGVVYLYTRKDKLFGNVFPNLDEPDLLPDDIIDDNVDYDVLWENPEANVKARQVQRELVTYGSGSGLTNA